MVVSVGRFYFPFDLSILIVIGLVFITTLAGVSWHRTKFMNEYCTFLSVFLFFLINFLFFKSLEESKKNNPEAIENKSLMSKIKQFTFSYSAITSFIVIFVSLVVSIFFYEYPTGKFKIWLKFKNPIYKSKIYYSI